MFCLFSFKPFVTKFYKQALTVTYLSLRYLTSSRSWHFDMKRLFSFRFGALDHYQGIGFDIPSSCAQILPRIGRVNFLFSNGVTS